jgi:glucose dehydrogenase
MAPGAPTHVIAAIFDAGFSYWGLFPVLLLIAVGYALWMWWVER